MRLKKFSKYLERPLENHERVQANNFKSIIRIITLDKEKVSEYDYNSTGFLNPHENNYMKEIIEHKNPGYELFLLFDNALRKTNNVLRCLIPKTLVRNNNLQMQYNTCLMFSCFKKIIVTHKGQDIDSPIGRWPIIVIDDFEIINPIKLRLLTAKESYSTQKLRNEILFGELDVDVPAYVKLAILNSLFLSPKIGSRSGIETKSFIHNSAAGRFLINLDNYNNMILNTIPPEISNSHFPYYNGDFYPHYLESTGEYLNININYPTKKYYFNAVCTPNKKEDKNLILRTLSNNELGINHQTKFKTYTSRKELIDKLTSTEFFFLQDYLPGYSIKNMDKAIKLIRENKESLFNDYVSRLHRPLPKTPLSISGRQRILALAQNYCMEIGYTIKQGSDSYVNSVRRLIQERLTRVNTIINRSGFKTNKGLETLYLMSEQLNFDEIRESKNFKALPDLKVDTVRVRQIMNNIIRSLIISSLKVRGKSATEEEILNECRILGHKEEDINREIKKLLKAGYIWKVNNIIYLIDNRI